MVVKLLLYLVAFFVLVAAISYSDSGVSASIQVSAVVEQPLGFSSFSLPEADHKAVQRDQLFLRLPQNESAVCIIETTTGQEYYYSLSEDLLPLSSISTFSNEKPEINLITIIYTEN